MREIDKKSEDVNRKPIKLHYFPNIPLKNLVGSNKSALVDYDEAKDINKNKDKNKIFWADIEKKNDDEEEKIKIAERKKLYEQGFSDGEKEGYQKGLKVGEKVGIEIGKEEIKTAVNSIHKALSELSKVKKEIYQNTEEEIVELAFMISQKVILHELAINKKTVIDIVENALEKIVDYEKVIIKVNTKDMAIIKTNMETIRKHIDSDSKISLEADDKIEIGGCKIQTNFGEIDARIETQLRLIKEAFDKELKKGKANQQAAISIES